ncbi:MAG: hypothetical protein IJL97_03965, partial [Lachnospiraceae bacterium]|nr:hypothetical protein [Lachnospiraceae bacterium]
SSGSGGQYGSGSGFGGSDAGRYGNRSGSRNGQQGDPYRQQRDANRQGYGGPTMRRPQTRHRCTVCGKTELDGINLEFRYCSKCAGSHEYCYDHLFTHVHIQ